MTQKICKKCGQSKDIAEFGIHSATKDGLRSICKKCNSLQVSEYFHSHKQEKTEYDKKYNLEHSEDVKVRKHIYYQNNKSWLNPLHKEYRNTHDEYREKKNIRANEYAKLWKKSPIGRILSKLSSSKGKAKRRERNKLVDNSLSSKDVLDLLKIQDNKCARCTSEFSDKIPYTLDHIVPLSLGGGLTRNNVQLLCHSCNSKKSTKIILYRKMLPDELAVLGGI